MWHDILIDIEIEHGYNTIHANTRIKHVHPRIYSNKPRGVLIIRFKFGGVG